MHQEGRQAMCLNFAFLFISNVTQVTKTKKDQRTSWLESPPALGWAVVLGMAYISICLWGWRQSRWQSANTRVAGRGGWVVGEKTEMEKKRMWSENRLCESDLILRLSLEPPGLQRTLWCAQCSKISDFFKKVLHWEGFVLTLPALLNKSKTNTIHVNSILCSGSARYSVPSWIMIIYLLGL